MRNLRKKKLLPVTHTPYDGPTRPVKSAGHHLIRKFHVLIKLQDQLLAGSSTSRELEDVQKEIESLGGLEAYQRMSARGQSKHRGGGSEKVFVGWLSDLGENQRKIKGKLSLLEVGAVEPDNYLSHKSWIDCTPIDLHSRHPLIHEQDFLKMDTNSHTARWDSISLSLVINFVPNPQDRGRMLSLAHKFLKERGYLFLVLPLPCVANSRYLNFDHLKILMCTVGFDLIKERWKLGGKMAYWLYQKGGENATVERDLEARRSFEKKMVLREGKCRNNFCILL